uniref:Exonuclease domain-containing protein n=1 Tax=Otolemur garnettii TaxID=30611 RepID=H0XTK9_OTOGA
PLTALGSAMEELERINRKIESVRTKVDDKQKRLSTFTSAAGELTQSPRSSSKDTNVRKEFPENSLIPKGKWNESSKNDKQPQKYVMDLKCPETDLEYDPLLGSAELLGTFKAKEDDTDQQHFYHLKKSVDKDCHLALESQRPCVSPIRIKINLQESDEDDLIIDVPPVTTTSKKSKISGKEKKKIDKIEITTQVDDKLKPLASLMNTSRHVESNVNLHQVKTYVSKKGSFEDEEKYDFISEEGISCAPLSDKEILKERHYENYAKSKKHVKICDTHKKETESWCSPSQPPIFYSDESVDSNVLRMQGDNKKLTTFEGSKLGGFDSDKGLTDDDTSSDSDDTMKECLHIFNEFTENEAHKESMHVELSTLKIFMNASGKQEMLYYKNTSRRKKRIAHTAKFHVPTNKEIISPFRGPVLPLISHTGIIRAQQQAVQIKAAVKSGQAFIAATSEQKVILGFVTGIFVSVYVCLTFVIFKPLYPSEEKLKLFIAGNILILSTFNNSNSILDKMSKYKVPHQKRASATSESSSKVPDEVRQRYLNLFVERYFRVCKTEEEALNKAKIEEKAIYERCGSRNMYVNIAVNSLKKLREQDKILSGSSNDKTTGLKNYEKKNVITGVMLYTLLKDYLLTEEELRENNYPQPHPEKPGRILLNPGMTKSLLRDASKKICCRCGKIYGVTSSGKHSRIEECNYHFGRVLSHKVLSGLESRYSCCGGVLGSLGCQVAKLHVHDQKENLEGFVKTFVKVLPADGNPGVFAVNCEVCYTAKGLELTRVTVVDSSLHVVYDTFVKPDEEVIDYNTRFSGVVEDDLKNTTTSIRDVQAILLSLFSADTIIIGHSFEYSLYALKLIHSSLVDTSVMFPHRLGLPYKRSLRSLAADYLQRIIPDDEYLYCFGGHKSTENAKACMELVLWKVKEDLRGKK